MKLVDKWELQEYERKAKAAEERRSQEADDELRARTEEDCEHPEVSEKMRQELAASAKSEEGPQELSDSGKSCP